MFPSTTRPSSYNDATQAAALASAGGLSGGFTDGHCTSGDYEAYQSDANGNRTSLRKRDGSELAYSYDALNRVTLKVVPERTTGPYPLDPAQTRDVHYSYDLRNLQLSARFDSQSGEGIANAYDGFGRVSSSNTNMGGTARTLSYAYNAHGARTQITHPDGIFFGTLHDALDRPYYAYDTVSAPIAYYTYTSFGTLGHSGHGAWTFHGYDGVQRPSARFHDFHGGAGAVLWTYAFNPAGGLSSVTRDNDAFAWTRHYGVSRTYTANGLNQYSAASSAQGNTSYGYDLNGNLTSDGTYTYAYDVENRLVSSSNGAALSYDPLGRLFQVTGGGNTTKFLYDGDALVVEYDTNGTVLRRHVHGAGADVPMITYAGADLSTPNNLFADHQGSIIAAAGSNGATLSVNTYDEYGIPGLGNTGRFQYTGQAWLAELGMYYYKARIYSPTFGRFLQTDPIGYDDQFNLYAYVGNDPVNHTDPDGKQAECWTCAVNNFMNDVNTIVNPVASTVNLVREVYTAIRDPNARNVVPLVIAVTPMGRVTGFLRVASSAYRTAATGGRHSGLLRRFMAMPDRQVQSSMRSHERTIAEHTEKIAHPERHMVRDSANDPAAVAQARRDWQGTIDRAREQRDIARDELRRRRLSE